MFLLQRLAALDGRQRLLSAYIFFLSLCFFTVIPDGKIVWALYAGLIVPASWRFLPELWRTVAASRLHWSLLLYLFFLLASLFWSPHVELKPLLARMGGAATMAHFILLTAGLRTWHLQTFDRHLGWLCCWVALSALGVMLVWYGQHPFPESRMEGLGYLDHPIRSAAAFGLFALIAWYRISDSPQVAGRLAYGLIFAIILAYICLSWTRSVLVAMSAALFFLLILTPGRRIGLYLIAFGAVTALVLGTILPDLTAQLIRAMPYRPYIWMDSFAHALQHPWLGQGYLAAPDGVTQLPDGTTFHYGDSHSFFLANFRRGGVLGLGLTLWTMGYSLFITFRSGRLSGNFLPFGLLIYGFLCITPNEWELLTGTKEGWIFFWFPLGWAISEELLYLNNPRIRSVTSGSTSIASPCGAHSSSCDLEMPASPSKGSANL